MTKRQISNTFIGLAFICSTFYGVGFHLGKTNLNPERVYLLVAPFVILLNMQMVSGRRPLWPGLRYYMAWWLAALVALALCKGPLLHITGLIIYGIPVVYFMMAASGPDNASMVDRWIFRCLIICLVLTVLAYSGLVPKDLLFEESRLHLFMFEPNILGAVVGAFIILMLPSAGNSIVRRVVMALSGVVMLLSFSKAPYAAFCFCIMLYYAILANKKGRAARFTLSLVGVAVLISLLALAFSDDIMEAYNRSLERQDAINARLIILAYAWEGFLQHPMFGNGPLDISISAPSLMTEYGSSSEKTIWIAQIFLATLYDAGLFGFIPFILLMKKLIFGFSMANSNMEQAKRGASYVCAFVMLFLCSQATTTHLNAIFGLVAGLLASYIGEQMRRKQTGRAVTG